MDTSQRSMDVAKVQQTNEEDPEFVRQRRAAIDTLLTGQISKTQRFAEQDVIRGTNLAKGFEQASQRMPIERPNTASVASSSSSISNKPTNLPAAAAAIKANTRCKHTFSIEMKEPLVRSFFKYQNGRKIKLLMKKLKMINDEHNRIVNNFLDVILMMMMMIDRNEVVVVLDGVDEVEVEDVVMMMEVKRHVRVKM